MELQSVKIVNFRPFRDVEADFTDTEGHIHLIEGPQGAGKTSFHRAVQWGLFGGPGRVHNYKTNWNARAREEGDERMEVHLKFTEAGRSYTVVREIDRFNHNSQSAIESLTLFRGDEVMEDEDAQEFIHERLPEDLRRFFFLDGEEIQDLIGEDAGGAVKREIETVLKHQAIINAQEDLDVLVGSRYAPDRNEMEQESKERDELLEEIQDLREDERELKRKKKEKQEERRERIDERVETRELLEEQNQEAIERLDELEDRIGDLQSRHGQLLQDLRGSWDTLPVAILGPRLEDAASRLRDKEQRCGELLRKIERNEVVEDLAATAREGPCPICGLEDGHPQDVHELREDVDGTRNDLTGQKVQHQKLRRRLEAAPALEETPAEVESQLDDVQREVGELEDERDELVRELGGQIREGERDQLEGNLETLNRKINDLDRDIEELDGDIKEKRGEIKKLENERQKRAGNQQLEELYAKIDAAESVRDALDRVRERHIQRKRDKIRDEMNNVFDRVSQSEFISGRYKGIEFKGEAEDEDEYVLQLVHRDGSRKNMDDHPPSAGETQLTALSFIFGLNKYAKYSTTIVFDTVAGRLDLANSQAQGEFFTTLDEPIVLLVTDAELQVLGEAMKDHVGVHYRLVPDKDMNSSLKEVSRR